MLPGSTEGIYGFVAANYASGALQQAMPDPESFLGVVELGGASLQVVSLTCDLLYNLGTHVLSSVSLSTFMKGSLIASGKQGCPQDKQNPRSHNLEFILKRMACC